MADWPAPRRRTSTDRDRPPQFIAAVCYLADEGSHGRLKDSSFFSTKLQARIGSSGKVYGSVILYVGTRVIHISINRCRHQITLHCMHSAKTQ